MSVRLSPEAEIKSKRYSQRSHLIFSRQTMLGESRGNWRKSELAIPKGQILRLIQEPLELIQMAVHHIEEWLKVVLARAFSNA